MTARRQSGGGSRYLYEPFEFASIHRLEAHERIVETRLESIESHFERLEQAVDRLERRIWMAVYGVASVVMAEVARVVFHFQVGG